MKRSNARRHYEVTSLERRTLLAAVYWDGGGDGISWGDRYNWSSDQQPTSLDDVTIDVPGDVIIQVQTNVPKARTLLCNEPMNIQSVNLDLSEGGEFNAPLQLSGSGGSITCRGGGLEFNAAVTLGRIGSSGNTGITFATKSQTLSGTGSISRAGEGTVSIFNSASDADRTLIIESDLELNLGAHGAIGSSNDGKIINNAVINIKYPPPANPFNDRFSISSQQSTFINYGDINISDSAICYIGNLDNQAGATVTSHDSQLRIYGGAESETLRWDNDGQITVENTSLWLAGYFHPENIGSFTRVGGSVTMYGFFDLEGTTFTLDDNFGDWYLQGQIKNGILANTNGHSITSVSSFAVFDNMRLDGTLVIDGGYSILVSNNLELNGQIRLGNASNNTVGTLNFRGELDQNLSGTGSITNYGAETSFIHNSNKDSVTNQGKKLTIGSGITMTLGPKVNVRSDYGMMENYGTLNFVGNGNLSASAATLQTATHQFINHGAINLSNAIKLTANSFQNAIGGTLSVSNSELHLNDGGATSAELSWKNSGSFTFNDSNIYLEGGFTLFDLGSFTRTNGMIFIVGVLDLQSSAWTLDDQFGDWTLKGGTISTGTINSINGHMLIPDGGTLDGLTLNTDLFVTTNTSLVVVNGLELNATITFAPPDIFNPIGLKFIGDEPMTVLGNGSIVLTSPEPMTIENDLVLSGVGQALVFGPGIDISIDQNSTMTSEPGGMIMINDLLTIMGPGTIGGQVTLGTTTSKFINNGTIDIANGAKVTAFGLVNNSGHQIIANNSTLTLSGSTTDVDYSFDNNGTINIADSTLNFAGLFESSDIGSISRFNTLAFLTGTVECNTAPLVLNASVGSLIMTSTGRIRNGVVQAQSGNKLITRGGTLEAVTMNAPVNVETASTLFIERGLTLNAAITLVNSSVTSKIEFRGVGSQWLSGSGSINSDLNGAFNLVNATRLTSTGSTGEAVTIDSLVTINFGTTGSITATYNGSSLINQGRINVNGNGLMGSLFVLGESNGRLKLINIGEVNFSNGVQGRIYDLTGDANTISISNAGTRVTLDGIYLLNGLSSVSDGGWVNLIGDWTITTGMDISATAVFLHEINPSNTYNLVKQSIIAGYNGGAWNGAGLRDPLAATNVNTTLGYAPAASVDSPNGFFHGVPVDVASTVVHHTLDADFDLDNDVGFNDLLLVAQNYNLSNRDFIDGDTNFDGMINFTDLLRTSQLYGHSLFASQTIAPSKLDDSVSHRSVLS